MMADDRDAPEEQVRKLRKINNALMARVERASDISGSAFALFQTAISLENEVRSRTQDLQNALTELSQSNASLEQARDEAEAARRNLAGALEAIQEGFALFDPDDRLVTCNRRFQSRVGAAADQIKPGLAFADYARLVAEHADLDLSGGATPDSWRAYRLEMHKRPDATFTLPLARDRWLQISERRTENGATAIIQTDVTDMVRRERRMRDQVIDEQARLARATLDQLSQGVCMVDGDHRLANCNTRFRELLNLPFSLTETGTSLRSILDYVTRTGELTPVREGDDLEAWIAQPPGDETISAEYHRSDGAIIQISLRGMPGDGFVASFTDVTAERSAVQALHRANETLEQRVTERTVALTQANRALTRENAEREAIGEALRRAKEAAEAANLSKTRFLAAASHDLLQPMSAAKLFIATLSDMPLEQPQREVADHLSGAFTSIETLLNALLDISRLDAGRAEYALADFPISVVLNHLEQAFRPLAAAKGLKLRIRPSALRIRSDPRLFHRIAQNLVANAVKYTQRGGVLVGARRQGGGARLEVWDSGPGVEPDDQERIFEEFQRLDQDAENRGMGLGLSIVHRACQLLDHPLTLRSQPGRGSVFAIATPLAQSEAPEAINPAMAPAGKPIDLDLLISVIENEPEVLLAMTRMLEGWGASVAPAASTEEALSGMAELGLPPDIIIADYHLDGPDTGLGAIRALRKEWRREIPAVLATADRSSALAWEARTMGVDLISKPVELRELRSLITWRSLASV